MFYSLFNKHNLIFLFIWQKNELLNKISVLHIVLFLLLIKYYKNKNSKRILGREKRKETTKTIQLRKPKPNMVYILVKPMLWLFVSLSAAILLCNGTHETSLKIVEHWPKKTVFFFIFIFFLKRHLFIFLEQSEPKKKEKQQDLINIKGSGEKEILKTQDQKTYEFRS